MASHDQQALALEEEFAQRPMSRATFARLYRYVRPYRRLFILNLVLTLLATAAQLAGPRLIQIGIDRHLASFGSSEAAARGILAVSAVYFAFLLAGWVLSAGQVKTAIAVGQGAMNDLRMAVFEHIQTLSLNYFDRTHQGRILSRADTDIDALDRVLTWGANQLLSSVITLAGVVVLLLDYDPRLFLAVSFVIPLLALATREFHRRGMEAYRRMRELASRLTSTVAENISGVRVVQAFGREDLNLSSFRTLHDEYGDRVLVAARVFHTYMPFVYLISGLATAVVLGYGGKLAMEREVTVGELAAFVLYLGMFFGPIHTMGDLYNSLLSTAACAERVFQLLDTQPQVRDREGARPLPELQGRVEFDSVDFRYDSTPEGTWILKGVSLDVEAGQTIALVGETGSGKTTIVSLLARFYEPQLGVIRVDGMDLRETQAQSLHRQLGIVTQDNFLFTGTVMENLKFGRPNASDEEVVREAAALGTDAVFRGLKDGYETKVGERGANLSAGERQLICLTRAMVARPRILILDEATSAVDPQSERVIQHALQTLFAGRTTFVIAHRLSTVRHADQILVLSGGSVVERGRHEELVAAGGAYARLHEEFVRR